MTQPENSKNEEREAKGLLWLMGVLTGCIVLTLFPQLVTSKYDPYPSTTRATITTIIQAKSSILVGYRYQDRGVSVERVQAFPLNPQASTHARLVLVDDGPSQNPIQEILINDTPPTLGIGSRVTIAYNPRNNLDAVMINPDPLSPEKQTSTVRRGIILLVCILLLLYTIREYFRHPRKAKNEASDPS